MDAKIGIAIILINKRLEVLVGKRKGSHGDGTLSLPGGHIEFGETMADCCDRELMEEIGLNFSGDYQQFAFSENFFNMDNLKEYPDMPKPKHYITLYFAKSDIDSDVIEIRNMEPHKCEGWNWVHIAKLPSNMFCDSYNQIIRYYEIMKYLKTNKNNEIFFL